MNKEHGCFFIFSFLILFSSCAAAQNFQGKIAFVSSRHGKHFSLCLLKEGQIKVIMQETFNPKWSRDGKKMLTANDKGLFVFDASGKRILFHPTSRKAFNSDWIDDNNVVFGAEGNLFTYNFSTNEEIPITNFSDGKKIGNIDVSPDGKRILVRRFDFTKKERDHFIININGEGREDVIFADGRFSPDGTKVVSTLKGGVIAIYDAQTYQLVNQIKSGIFASDPAFSPDGKQIVFNGTWSGIYVINIDGTGLKTILKPDPRGKNDVSFDWAA